MVLDAENLGSVFLQHRRGERPEPFTKLYLMIEYFAHVCPTRIGEKTACTQRPRAQFHAPTEPADNRSLGNHFCESRQQYIVDECFIFQAGSAECDSTFLICKAWPP